MKQCPDCRNPVTSLMFLDGKLVPEHYCERCCRSVVLVEKPAPASREKVAA